MICRICSNALNNKEYIAREMMFGYRDEFIYFQCSSCGCLQISEYPEKVETWYGGDYYSYQFKASKRNRIQQALRNRRDFYTITRKGLLGKLLSIKGEDIRLSKYAAALTDKNKSILDLGCGSGSLLRKLHDLSFHNLTGADPFIEGDIHIADNFVIHKKDIDQISGKYDFIICSHSLEHMPDQAKVFRNISRILSENGVCFIAIPVCSSYAWENYGVNWVQLDAPRHYYLHSVKSLRLVAENAGLEVIRIVFDSSEFQFTGSEGYLKDIPLRDERTGSLFTRGQLSRFRRKAEELNASERGDQAIFYLKHSASAAEKSTGMSLK
ncbi:MAG: class I SAM-dependent methyltransferase [Chlorobiaceae bacterium]|nr:class I SAM-dependent methyltransferase [Chlorobiaceae bacterium]